MWHLKCFDVTALNNPLWHKSPPCGEASLPDGVVFRFQIAPTSLGCDLASSAGLKRTASILFCSHTPILEKPPFQAVFLHSVKESRFSLAENRDSLTGFLFDKTFDKSFEKSIQFLIDV